MVEWLYFLGGVRAGFCDLLPLNNLNAHLFSDDSWSNRLPFSIPALVITSLSKKPTGDVEEIDRSLKGSTLLGFDIKNWGAQGVCDFFSRILLGGGWVGCIWVVFWCFSWPFGWRGCTLARAHAHEEMISTGDLLSQCERPPGASSRGFWRGRVGNGVSVVKVFAEFIGVDFPVVSAWS